MSTDASSTSLIIPDSRENTEASPGSSGSVPRADASIPSKHPDESPPASRLRDNILLANTPGNMESHQPPYIAQQAPSSRNSGAESQCTESLSGAHSSTVESSTLVSSNLFSNETFSSEDKSGGSYETHPDLKLPDFDPAVIAKWKEMPTTQDCSLNMYVSIFGGPTNPAVLEKRKRPKVNSTLTLSSIEDVSTLGPVKIHEQTEPTIPLDESSNSYGPAILTNEKKFDRKWSLLQDELGRLVEEKGFMDLQVALVYGKLGEALETVERYDDALEFYEKRLEIENQVCATDSSSDGHLQMASTYRSIAKVFSGDEKGEEAMKELEKALVINLKFHGSNHQDTGATYQAMGECYRAQGKGDEAMEYYQTALKVYGPEHLQTGEVHRAIGGILQWQDKTDQAIEQFQNALKVYGREHPKTSEIYRDIGNLFEKQGRHEEALQHFQMALDISLKVHRPDHCTTSHAYASIGRALALRAKDDEAVRNQVEMELETNLKAYGPELRHRYRFHLVDLLQDKERELYGKRWVIEEVLNLSLENQGIAITITQFDGETAVVEACFLSQMEIAGLGSVVGVDIEIDGEIHGASQGMKACFRGHIHKIVAALLENGVDSTAVNDLGLSALICASIEGFTEIVRILLGKGVSHTVQDMYGMTALMLACRDGHTEIVRLLLANGADPTVPDKDGQTALMFASIQGFTEIVRLLLANGTDHTVIAKDGGSALMYACRIGHIEIVRLLLANRADPTVTDKDGMTALMYACFCGHTKIVRLLLANGADPTFFNEDGHNALKNAARQFYIYDTKELYFEMFQLLVEHFSDPNLPDFTDTTALMKAAQKGSIETVEFLLRNGADITKMNAYERTALDLARREGHAEIVELLSNYSPPNKNAKQQT